MLARVLLLCCSLAAGSVLAGPGVLRVGTSGDYAPFSERGAGFDIEVAKRLARDLGLRVEWVAFRWPELSARIGAGDFDVAMSGVTWRAERSVHGWMSRAVAVGGPCLVGAREPATLAVNRGGVLERWARSRFPGARVRTVDDNLALPGLLARREVEAIATDSFELPHFARPGQPTHCDPARDRKVYWIAPARADDLGPRVDAWLERNEAELASLRAQWFGHPQPRDAIDHLVDLAARRLALMPAVAWYKRAHGLPIEDRERERVVLDAAAARARKAGLDPESLRESFALQVELAKRVQREAPERAPTLDLESELRPALLRLGDRLVAAYAAAAPLSVERLPASRLDLTVPYLDAAERETLQRALILAARRAPAAR